MSASPVLLHDHAAESGERAVTVHSNVLGTIEVPAESIVEFPCGLFGFPEARRFALVAVAGRSALFWLQSLEHRALTFVLVDPFVAIDGYTVDLPDADRHELRIAAPSDVAVLAIATLPRGAGEPCTVNLQGPIALNLRARIGRQLALAERGRGVRVPVDLAKCVG